MDDFFLNGFLNTKGFLNAFVKNNSILADHDSVHLMLLEGKSADIVFYDCIGPKIETSHEHIIKELLTPSPVIKNNHVDVRPLDKGALGLSGQGGFSFMVRNPFFEDGPYIAALIVDYNCKPSIEDLEALFNFDYLEQFLYHMETVFSNYSKLFLVVDSFTDILAKKDKFMPYHMTNVAAWCLKLAPKLNLSQREFLVLYIAALLHDIGKIYIEDRIINNSSKLSSEEFAIMKKHPAKGAAITKSILSGMTLLEDVPTIILHHHENFDGSGYPAGLSGKEIPYLSRILTIADGIDAMLSKRSYKDALSPTEVIVALENMNNLQYDSEITCKAIELMQEELLLQKGTFGLSSNFLGNVSLSFYTKNASRLHKYSGNLLSSNKETHFIVGSDYSALGVADINEIHKATLGVFQMYDYFEYSCHIERIEGNVLKIKDIQSFPSDKYLSVSMRETAMLLVEDDLVEIEIVKFGGNTIIFKLGKICEGNSCFLPKDFVTIRFNEDTKKQLSLDEITVQIVKEYESNASHLFVGIFGDIPEAKRDMILRFLFRKQLSGRMELKKHFV